MHHFAASDTCIRSNSSHIQRSVMQMVNTTSTQLSIAAEKPQGNKCSTMYFFWGFMKIKSTHVYFLLYPLFMLSLIKSKTNVWCQRYSLTVNHFLLYQESKQKIMSHLYYEPSSQMKPATEMVDMTRKPRLLTQETHKVYSISICISCSL